MEERKKVDFRLVFWLGLFAVLGVLLIVSINFLKGKDGTSGTGAPVSQAPRQDSPFISDYFDEAFGEEDTKETGQIEGLDKQTCKLFGEIVAEGTIIYDSACTIETKH